MLNSYLIIPTIEYNWQILVQKQLTLNLFVPFKICLAELRTFSKGHQLFVLVNVHVQSKIVTKLSLCFLYARFDLHLQWIG